MSGSGPTSSRIEDQLARQQRQMGLQLAQHGRMDSAAVAEKRKLVLKVRGWIYEVIERFLGGVAKPPNRVGLGALPHLIVGGVVVVTVASIGAWVANEEERLVNAKRLFAQTVAQASKDAADPVVRRKLADLAGSVADEGGLPWRWILAALALAGGVQVAGRRQLRPRGPAIGEHDSCRLQPVPSWTA